MFGIIFPLELGLWQVTDVWTKVTRVTREVR